MKKILLALITIALLLYGCGGGGKSSTGPSDRTPFIGGTNGIIVSFSDGAPPPEAYDGNDFPFDIDIKLKNEGEAFVDKSNIKVQIRGINPEDFSKTPASLIISPIEDDLEAKKKDADGNVIEGTEVHVLFEDLTYGGELSGNLEFPIQAEICYTYQTKANAKLCIKEDLTDTTDTDICTVTEEKEVYNSGAPIQVTSFKESAVGTDKISIIFIIEHKGNGDVFEKEKSCANERSEENKVWVEIETGDASLSCSGLNDGDATSGFVTLYNGERSIRCTQSADVQTDYVKQAEITLTYDYQEEKITNILMKHMG